jgi:hypothetical protein
MAIPAPTRLSESRLALRQIKDRAEVLAKIGARRRPTRRRASAARVRAPPRRSPGRGGLVKAGFCVAADVAPKEPARA